MYSQSGVYLFEEQLLVNDERVYTNRQIVALSSINQQTARTCDDGGKEKPTDD